MDLQQKFLDSQETLFSDEENVRILFTDLQPCMPTVIANRGTAIDKLIAQATSKLCLDAADVEKSLDVLPGTRVRIM